MTTGKESSEYAPAADNASPDLSIIIPAYDEETDIESVPKRIDEILHSLDHTAEIIVCDDSTDRIREIAREVG